MYAVIIDGNMIGLFTSPVDAHTCAKNHAGTSCNGKTVIYQCAPNSDKVSLIHSNQSHHQQ